MTMRTLYETAWGELRTLRASYSDIEREGTPILAFGRFETARVITAGLNPSEDEFRDSKRLLADGSKEVLRGSRQRFLHWGSGELTEARVTEAFRRSEGYFELGNKYGTWFDRYSEFLEALGCPFVSGKACHTDYISPFATRTGISKCSRETAVRLKGTGLRYWMSVLESCPRLELVFGHGQGWRRVQEEFQCELKDLKTPFDGKGNSSRCLSFSRVTLPNSLRPILLYWWHPNRDGSPLCFLNAREKGLLGDLIKNDAAKRAPDSGLSGESLVVLD